MPTDDWSTLINAALAIYGIKQGQKTPNFYQVPETPTETWRNDQTKNLYSTASAFTDQYMKGLGNLNPDFHLNNDMTGNPAFMGGVKVPTIDFSKVPSSVGAGGNIGANTATPSAPYGAGPFRTDPQAPGGTGAGPNGLTPTDVLNKTQVGGPGDGPADGETIYDYLSRNPSGNANQYLPNQGKPLEPGQLGGGLGYAGAPSMADVSKWAESMFKDHPTLFRAGVDVLAGALGQAFGMPAGIAASVADKLQRYFAPKPGPTTPTPTTPTADPGYIGRP